MSVDKLVDSTQLDSDLASVANAIRTKGGTSAQLTFPSDFVSAIQAIPTGGSGDDNANLIKQVTNTLTSARLDLGGLAWKERSFNTSTALTNVFLENVGSGYGQYCFYNCTGLITAVLKASTSFALPSHTFNACNHMTKLDLTNFTLGSGSALINSSVLTTLVIRNRTVAALGNINVFSGTPFASGGSGGTLYVPSSLVSSYQNASNWSTILGYANNQIKSIESTHTDPTAPVDLTTHYADGTLISS